MGRLHTLRKIAPWLAGALCLLALLLLGLMRTVPGHRAVEWLVATTTGGEVIIAGLGGPLPNRLHAARIDLRDEEGVWLRVENVALDWSALAAFFGHVAVRQVSADRIAILRYPRSDESASGKTPRIDIDAMSLPQIALGSPLVGHAAQLSARGSLHYASRHDLGADIIVIRPGSSDRYVARGRIARDVANGEVSVSEGATGLLGALIGLPGLRPVNLRAYASGDRAANALTVTLSAGALRASGKGLLALADRRADITIAVNAPAMQLRPALGWQALSAQARFSGGFDAPDIQADFRLADFKADGLAMTDVTVDAQGHGGQLDMTARIAGLRIPGRDPGLFAGAPATAKLSADLAAESRPVQFSVSHPVLVLRGRATTRGKLALDAGLSIPSLAPFGTMTGGPLAGPADLTVSAVRNGAQTTLAMNGELRASGPSLAAKMLGHATVTGQATLNGSDISGSQLTLDGAGLALRVTGALRADRLDYRVALDMKDLSRLTAALAGHASLSGRISGPAAKALVEASGTADLARKGSAPQRMNIRLRALGLPEPVSASFKADGRFDGAMLALDAVLASKGKARTANVSANWKSLAMRADFTLPAAGAPTGRGTLDIGSLNDLSSFTGTRANGDLHLAARLTAPGDRSSLVLQGRAADLALAESSLGALTFDGTVSDPFRQPALALKFTASSLAAQGWSGEGGGELNGPLDGILVSAQAHLVDPQGMPAQVAVKAVLDSKKQSLNLQQLKADWHGESVSLIAPALVSYSDGIRVNHFRLAAGGGTIAVSGQVSPMLALTGKAEGIRAEAISLFLPEVSVSGTLSATADLRGTLASPRGNVTLLARNVRNRVYAVTASTAADISARAVLQGTTATLDAILEAGKNGHVTLAGTAPLTAGGSLNLRLAGRADLALLDPMLASGGQRMRGAIEMDALVSGSLAAPRVRGSANLANGEFQDFARGIHLRDIEATLKAKNDGLHLVNLSAAAGPGTVTGSGTIDVWSPGMPLDLTIRADNARPIVSDLLTASLSGTARLAGKLNEDMTLKGAITIPRAEVKLPQSFPPEVRTLNVRHRGQPAPQTPSRGGSVALSLTVHTTGPVTLRGRGIDADLGGNLAISGSAQAPRIGGGFQMRRGTFSIAGQTLNFSTGRITFDGTGVRGRMDPALDFVASQTSGGVTATLNVGGYASLPKITLSSSPPLPQDEVLARLLFQQSAKQLSPLQIAQGAQALASIAGVDSGFSPLSWLRGGLGLDRLSVGSASGPTAGTTVETGKYISRNVYVGARQGVSGGTQAQVQVDLTKNLKAQATVSTGANAAATKGATAAEDQGNSIGLSYQFDY